MMQLTFSRRKIHLGIRVPGPEPGAGALHALHMVVQMDLDGKPRAPSAGFHERPGTGTVLRHPG